MPRQPKKSMVDIHFFFFLQSLRSLQHELRTDSRNSNTSLPGTFCGPDVPQDLVSDGNHLHLAFSSNDRVVDVGFAATWRAIDPTEGKAEDL